MGIRKFTCFRHHPYLVRGRLLSGNAVKSWLLWLLFARESRELVHLFWLWERGTCDECEHIRVLEK